MRSLSNFTAEARRMRRKRREEPETSFSFSLRLLCALRVSAVSLLFFPLMADAQTGEITGRVVSGDGGGLPNVGVFLNPVVSGRRSASNYQPETAVTDVDGNFKFTGLAARQYNC